MWGRLAAASSEARDARVAFVASMIVLRPRAMRCSSSRCSTSNASSVTSWSWQPQSSLTWPRSTSEDRTCETGQMAARVDLRRRTRRSVQRPAGRATSEGSCSRPSVARGGPGCPVLCPAPHRPPGVSGVRGGTQGRRTRAPIAARTNRASAARIRSTARCRRVNLRRAMRDRTRMWAARVSPCMQTRMPSSSRCAQYGNEARSSPRRRGRTNSSSMDAAARARTTSAPHRRVAGGRSWSAREARPARTTPVKTSSRDDFRRCGRSHRRPRRGRRPGSRRRTGWGPWS